MIIMNSKLSKSDFWKQKPSWCQPWSIVITGLMVIGLSLWWPNRIFFTCILFLIILFWWTLFLFIAPLQYSDQQQVFNDMEND